MSALPVRVGILGSSWWADSMYLPALAQHPSGRVTAIAGRTAAALADRWQVPHTFARYEDLIRHEMLRAHGIYYFVPGMLQHFDSEAVMALAAPRQFRDDHASGVGELVVP